VTGSLLNYYCSDGNCYSRNQLGSNLVCSNNFTQDFQNPVFPSTYQIQYNIDHLELVDLAIQKPNQTWVQLNQGQTIRLNLQSTADKSAYINLAYNGEGQTNSTLGKQVQFLVFNNRLKTQRIFDVTALNTVLLPQSQDNFTVYLAANGGNFNITLTASQSVMKVVSAVAMIIVACVALIF
jgi:hypothetical protein